MRASNIVAALLFVVGAGAVDPADAELDAAATLSAPASTLIMPFDNTTNHVSFQMVTNPSRDPRAVAVLWSYWSDEGRHLVDVFTCLTPYDSTVMDPTRVVTTSQSPNPPMNFTLGGTTDLSGERGLVLVTAVLANTSGNFPFMCEGFVGGPPARVIGSWVIADTSTNFAFGADGIGMGLNTLPDADALAGGLLVPTFDPESLQESLVIILTVETSAGAEPSAAFKLGPIQRDRPDIGHVCCAVTFLGPDDMMAALPDLCIDGVGFHPISARQATPSEVPIIPSTETIAGPGVVRLSGCTAADGDGEIAPVGSAFEQFLFAVHGQAIGPFGFATYGTYATSVDG